MSNKSSQSILTKLYDNRSLRVKVETLMDEGKSIAYIQTFCTNQGFEISHGSLNNYKKKREEALRQGVPLESLLDRRANTGEVVELKRKEEVNENIEPITSQYERFNNTGDRLVSTLEFLDMIVQKGFNTIQQVEQLDPALAIKAIDQIEKLSKSNGGLTIHGLQQLRLHTKAMENSYTTAILEFIPEEKHAQVLERIEEAEKEFYANLDLDAEGRRVKEVLKNLDLG